MAKKTGLIGYCGLYCGTCPGYTQAAANLARDLRKELRSGKFDEAAPALAKIPDFKSFKHYQKFCDLLNTIMKMRCGKPCKAGGGSAQCPIKKCVKKKRLDGCWQCDDFITCKKLKGLEQFGDTTYLKNLRKIKRLGPAAFVREKTRRFKSAN
jgi:hypothetical protein